MQIISLPHLKYDADHRAHYPRTTKLLGLQRQVLAQVRQYLHRSQSGIGTCWAVAWHTVKISIMETTMVGYTAHKQKGSAEQIAIPERSLALADQNQNSVYISTFY